MRKSGTAPRMFALAGVVVLSVAMTGCSTGGASGGAKNSGGGTTSIVSSTSAPEQAVIKLFEKKYAGAKVTDTTAPAATYSQVVTTQLAGGSAADIIRAYPGNGSNLSVVQATKKGFYGDLSGLSFVNKIPSSLRSVLLSSSGKVSGVPVTTSAIGGVYNMKVLKDVGATVPQTWDGVLQYCSKVKAAGKVPYGLGLKDSWTGQFVPYALSATLLPATFSKQQSAGTATFANSAWRTVFTKYLQMKNAGCFSPQPNGTSYANVEDQLANGSTAGSVTLTDTIGDVKKINTSADMQFAALPATNSASQTKLSDGIGVVLALNAKAKDPATAKKLLNFFSTPAAQAAYSKAAGTLPALNSGDAFSSDVVNKTVSSYTSKDMVASWPDQSWPNPNVQQVHFTAVQGLFAGTMSVTKVLAALDKAYSGK